jgi:hypothetical protein
VTAATAAPVLLSPSNAPPSVELAWNAAAIDIILGPVTNYNIYEGAASGQYTVEIPAGTNLVLTVSNLARGTQYFFNVTSQAGGLESGFGGEISYTPQPPPPAPVFQPIIILHAQASPAATGPWTDLAVLQVSATNAAGFFRTQIASSQ